MKTRIVRIGNSQGIRIPKPLLEASGIQGEVELKVEDGRIIIESATTDPVNLQMGPGEPRRAPEAPPHGLEVAPENSTSTGSR